jgi:hypothetical protein
MNPLDHRLFRHLGYIRGISAGSRHVGKNETRRDGVDGDAVRSKVHRETAGDYRNGGFGGCIKGGASHRGTERSNRG